MGGQGIWRGVGGQGGLEGLGGQAEHSRDREGVVRKGGDREDREDRENK
jgi:hypothetical protein